MERRGVYRKGSAGHVRNASAYRIAREHFKRWRTPITAFMVLMFVFGVAPVVGDGFQASLLTSDEIVETVQKDPVRARKVVLDYMHEFVKECDRFSLDECVGVGQQLIAQVSDVKSNLQDLMPALIGFEQKFDVQRAQAACKYDLSRAIADLHAANSKLEAFVSSYGESIKSEAVAGTAENLQDEAAALAAFVDLCGSN